MKAKTVASKWNNALQLIITLRATWVQHELRQQCVLVLICEQNSCQDTACYAERRSCCASRGQRNSQDPLDVTTVPPFGCPLRPCSITLRRLMLLLHVSIDTVVPCFLFTRTRRSLLLPSAQTALWQTQYSSGTGLLQGQLCCHVFLPSSK
jgi:hypothetical protein